MTAYLKEQDPSSHRLSNEDLGKILRNLGVFLRLRKSI